MPAPIPANRFVVWTVPSYDQWMKDTALGFMKPRSDHLKRIDEALKIYWQTPPKSGDNPDIRFRALRTALNNWKLAKASEGGWEKSARNKTGLITQLSNAIAPASRTLTPEQIEGIKFQEMQRRLAVQRLFSGKKVTLKISKTAAAGATLVYDVRRCSNTANTASATVHHTSSNTGVFGPIEQAVKEMIIKMFDVHTIETISQHLIMKFGPDLIASMVPILGHLKGGVHVVKEWSNVAYKAWTQHSNTSHAYAFRTGDPSHAFKALDSMLKTEISRATTSAGIVTADFTIRTTLFFADGGTISGPMTGAASALAKLTHAIYGLACEYRQTQAVNKILLDPGVLGFRLFEAKPLLGCYMLCCAEDYDIIAMTAEEFGVHGWMDSIEDLKKNHIHPVRVTAHQLIEKSIYEIEGLTSLADRGVTAMNMARTLHRKIIGGKKYAAGGYGDAATRPGDYSSASS